MTRTRHTPFAHTMCRRVLGLCALAAVQLGGSTVFALGLGAPGGAPGFMSAPAEFGTRLNSEIAAAGTAATSFAAANEGVNARPSGGAYAFPPRPRAAAFSVEPILLSRSDWRAGAPVYTPTVMTGLDRTGDRELGASDVTASATAGLVVSRAVAHHRAVPAMPEHLYMGKRGLGLKFGF